MSVGAESLDNHESVAERRSAPERLVAVTSVVGSCVVAVTFRDRITRSYPGAGRGRQGSSGAERLAQLTELDILR